MKDTDNSAIFQIMKNEKSDADVIFCAWSRGDLVAGRGAGVCCDDGFPSAGIFSIIAPPRKRVKRFELSQLFVIVEIYRGVFSERKGFALCKF
jgi:hypothetical protein